MGIIRDENLNCKVLIIGSCKNPDLSSKESMFIMNLASRLHATDFHIMNENGDYTSVVETDFLYEQDGVIAGMGWTFYDVCIDFDKTSVSKNKKIGAPEKCLSVVTDDKSLLSVSTEISKCINKIIFDNDVAFAYAINRKKPGKKIPFMVSHPRNITINIFNEFTDIDAMASDSQLYDELCETIKNIIISHRI